MSQQIEIVKGVESDYEKFTRELGIILALLPSNTNVIKTEKVGDDFIIILEIKGK